MSRQTRGYATAALAIVAALAVAVAATLADGRSASRADTNDGGAWLLHRDAGAVGHVNRRAQELTGAVRIAEPRTMFDVDQARGVVLVHDISGARASLIDDRTYTPSTNIEVPELYDLHAVQGGLVAFSSDPATLRRIPLDALPEFDEVGDIPPDVEEQGAALGMTDRHDRAVLVTFSGTVFVQEPDGTVAVEEMGPYDQPPTAVTVVDRSVVVLTEGGEVQVIDAGVTSLEIDSGLRAGDWTLQQPGLAAGQLVVVDPDGQVLELDLATGEPSEAFELDGGLPIPPIVHEGCVFAVSTQPATFARGCGDDLYSTSLVGADGRPPGQLRLRLVNGWVWLNDVDTGTVWVADVEGELTQIDDWGVALAEDDGSEDEEISVDGPADQQRENPDEAERFVQADQIIDDGPNEPPVARDDNAATRQERAVIVDVLANDTDPNGDVLLVSDIDDRSGDDALVSVTSDRRAVQVDPAVGFTGTIRFSYEVSDGRGGFDTAEVTVDVTPLTPERNRAPVPVTDIVTIRAGETATINVLLNDTDPDGDSLVLLDVVGEGAQVRWSPDGTVTITPDPDVEGRLEYTYLVADEWGATAEGRIRIDVRLAGSNQPPDARHDAAQTIVGRPVILNVLDNDTDPDGDALLVQARPELVQAPEGSDPFYTLATDGELFFEAQVAGTYVLRYTVSDGSLNDSALVRIEVFEHEGNLAPIAVRDDITIPVGSSRVVPVLRNDRDPDGDVLSIVDVAAPEQLRVEVIDGVALRITPREGATGLLIVRYFISDGVNDPVSAIVAVLVVDDGATDLPPVVAPDRFDVRGGQLSTLAVLANDHDPEGGALRIVGVTDPAEATVSVTSDQQRVRIDVPTSTSGSFTFGYTVEDDARNQASTTVSIRVVPDSEPNRAPIANPDVARTLRGTPVTIDVLANDRDPDGDAIRVAGVARQPGHGHAVLLPDGRVEYRPDRRFTGTDRFAYTIVDAGGLQAVGEVLVGVLPPWHENRPPEARDDVAVVTAGSGPTLIDVLANDRDPDGDPLAVVRVGEPARGQAGIAGDGRAVVYEPPDRIDEEEVQVAFRYTIDDGRGGQAEATVTVRITSAEVDQPPVARDDVVGPVSAGEELLVDVLSNDRNPSGSLEDLVLSVSDPDLRVVQRQIALIAPATTRSYLYTVTDPETSLTANAALSVLIVANRAPVVTLLEVETPFNEPIELDLTGQASDPDGDPLFFSCCSTERGGRATVTSTDASTLTVTFQPDSDHEGPAGFSYLVDDRQGHQVAGSVAIEVLPPDNRPPEVRDAEVEVEAGSSRVVDLADLVDDPDEEDIHTFQVEVGTGPFDVAVSESRLTISAAIDATGATGEISVTATDPAGASDAGVISVEVVPTSQPPPEARPDQARTIAGEPVVVPVLDNDLGDGLRVVRADGVQGVAARVVQDGRAVEVTPDGAFSGTATVSYTIRDAFDVVERESTGRIEVTVIGPPDLPGAPTVTADSRQATMTWPAPGSNGAPIEAYEIEHDQGARREVGAQTSFTWSDLTNGTTYRFRVRARNEAGWSQPGPWSAPVTPNEVPGRPAPPRVTFGDTRLEVAWTRPQNPGSPITSYLLEIGGATSNVREVPAGSQQQSLTWDGLRNGSNYTFRVKAINDADPGGGEWSDWSEPERPLTQPSPPARPTLSNGPNFLDVAWAIPADGGDPIQEFEIEIDTGGRARVSGAGTTGYRWADLPNGEDHRFRVRAWNRDGRGGQWSEWSEPGRACDVPRAVAQPGVSRGDRAATVTWTAPDARGCNLTGYEVTVNDGSTVRAAGSGTRTLTWDGLTNGQEYTFRVRALNEMGAGAWSDASPGVIPAGPPLATTISSVEAAGERRLRVRWAAAGDNGRPIQRYEVSVDGGSPVTVSSGLEDTFDGLTAGRTYGFRVRAVNEIGTASWSPTANRMAEGVPGQVAAPSSTAPSRGEARWSWSVPATNGSDIAQYRIEVQRLSGSSWVAHATDTTTATSRTYTGLSDSTRYRARVQAENGYGWGAYSSWKEQTTQAPPPPPPSVTIAKGGNAQGASGGFEGGGCTRTTCRWIEIRARDFAPNTSLEFRFQDVGPAQGCNYSAWTTFGTRNHSTDASGAYTHTSGTYFYAYPGCDVRVRVDGVTSNVLSW